MSDQTPTENSLEALTKEIDNFAKDRDWGKFHTPKNLAMALSVEASELMEIFQWDIDSPGIENFSPKKRACVEQEVADVFIYLLRFCSVTGVDIMQAAQKKIELNAKKYPADLVHGRSDKYTEY
ncbi:nucleotide pyrophosphohydrolase [Dyella sp. C9]|uniref:nucleotide pyrophosphohydrolase n=1 Tax=Dyella sp. C9 TaxID=2202154 RepID=UPI000DEF2AE1|nr:nucleotide pyrophosphohydrolase [Dyella sp. C9]